ncbi:helix-turn-helix domain-containing protein [Natranaeroarchaeum sulfidigenes]|uniref:Transcriptional regulator, contains HTH domain n=1 Tax=Natranaeroarchaeum sulfidigenes TaxID=2784880 RepID=A0A897MS26_9EURY|nr:helix-turn-helix domain-containing protein [Natranaeroarchaeum sulfidigenes]QSG01769.1 Transcriptional regulator, contains HTH domain [Natranaeroarchaeum sulfidigenes]
MSVIAEFRVPAGEFELGRILTVAGTTSIELESLVPTGEATVPLFWIHDVSRDSFTERIEEHPTVNDATTVDVFEGRTLFTLDWDANQDHLFAGIGEYDGHLLSAVGTADTWKFEIRFPEHELLTKFTDHCERASISLEITRIYNPTEPDAGPWYGLTERQREAMELAIQMGYYEIPRGCTTNELAAELGISDQAVTERLRRAIVTLAKNTLVPSDSA